MVQNSNDIYKLIKSKQYNAVYTPADGRVCDYVSYAFFNTNKPTERINVEIHKTHMDIYKFNNMNSEYYETIRTTNKCGQKTLQRFKDQIFVKNIAAMMRDVEQNYR